MAGTMGGGGTIFHCQRALAKEIAKLTKEMLFEDAASGQAEEKIESTMRVYMQNLPIAAWDVKGLGEDEDDSIEFKSLQTEDALIAAPWCNIKIDNVKTEGPNEEQRVRFAIIMCLYDSGTGRRGHEGLLNIMQRVTERFMKDPLMDHAYRNNSIFKSEIAEEDTHPYYFGVTVTEFYIRGTQRELEGEWC